jgi:hypothetical protein
VIYGVTTFTFKYHMRIRPGPSAAGNPQVSLLTFPFDEILSQISANTQIHIGPGIFQTRGFAPNDSRGWQPKTRQKIVGAGVDITTLQLVGAENGDQHYHVIGMPIEPNGSTAIVPLESFEVSDLTIDCNLDNQPTRLNRYAELSVSLLSRVDTTATASVADHTLQNGDTVVIEGATGPDSNLWNGTFRIGNVHSDSFDYIMSAVPSSTSASGMITALKIIPYSNVACGAVRILGTQSRVSRVKVINWGTKSLKQGCFVISILIVQPS